MDPEPSMSLMDLPSAWLFLLSTNFTAETAARPRCSCKAMQQVIDATWEPEEVLIPPHRRSVPLTMEQVEAQLPPQVELLSSSGRPWDDDWYSWINEDIWAFEYAFDEVGRSKVLLSAFGPALTRLTANQALNTLQGKSVLCYPHDLTWLDITNRDAMHERLRGLEEVIFKNNSQSWPPEDRYCADFFFYGELHASEALQRFWRDKGYKRAWHPRQILTTLDRRDYSKTNMLLSTSESSCRDATRGEEWQFYDSTAAADADKFDMYLTFGREPDDGDIYVFLDPTRCRFTGRLKPTAAF